MVARSAIGLIAGSGRLPEVLAESVRSQGRILVVLMLPGAADGAARLADHRYDVGFGDLQRILAVLREHDVRELVFAGSVPRMPRLDQGDAAFHAFLTSHPEQPGQALFLRGVDLLQSMGIQVRSPLDVRPDLATPEGVLTARGPTQDQWDDVRRGLAIARTLAGEEIGQTVAVAQGVVVAVEAAEGTDATIRRAGTQAPRAVIVKAARPDQDKRFDLPTAGPDTIQTMWEAGAALLALEAGSTLLVDRDAAVTAANDAGIGIVGITFPMADVRGPVSGT